MTISINEGEFPNIAISWRFRTLYVAITRRWKFIITPSRFRFGPWWLVGKPNEWERL